METSKGLFLRKGKDIENGEILFGGSIYMKGEKPSAWATLQLNADPLPTLFLEIEGKEVRGFLEMNATQSRRAEPDFLNLISINDLKYAAGVWIPREKLREPWFLLILRAVGQNDRASETPECAPTKSPGAHGTP
ncbi:hypothetical protein [Shimia thalassica]|uniref:hypothetical protein n=1 Tax=Shimia thalassica TaxID=1715693 RepID=UPI0026E32757|nr:hypothetical protein [Shimia thalassica]MDO6481881.1 hypothetical protein [Shimia thalassica]